MRMQEQGEDSVQDVPEPQITTGRDPQPSVERIESLAQGVLSGDIVLPAFQRDFDFDAFVEARSGVIHRKICQLAGWE
jgi:hypothetical protein